MAIPLHCPSCGELVGMDEAFPAGLRPGSSIAKVICPGVGKHTPPTRTSIRRLFGLIERITVLYPETLTRTFLDEYTGPKSTFLLWLAIMCSHGGRIIINGKLCWWDIGYGFCGDGAEEFYSV